MAEEIILYPLIVLYEVLLMIFIIRYFIDQKLKKLIVPKVNVIGAEYQSDWESPSGRSAGLDTQFLSK